eukprot:1138328-Pelagomonas_calceolata.AAC.1
MSPFSQRKGPAITWMSLDRGKKAPLLLSEAKSAAAPDAAGCTAADAPLITAAGAFALLLWRESPVLRVRPAWLAAFARVH